MLTRFLSVCAPAVPKPVRLLERERGSVPYASGARATPPPDAEDAEEVDDARRWRCIAVGSTSGRRARRAKMESTSTMETTPERLAACCGGEGAASSETKSRCELAGHA